MLDQIADLVKLAGDDAKARQKISDMIAEKTTRGGQLPSVEDVRRRLGLHRELDSSETFGEAWAAWPASRRTDELGRALHPEYVSRRFRELAKTAGLPVIKFHAVRHTAATLALESKVDIKIVSEMLGHSTTRITQDLYQHVRIIGPAGRERSRPTGTTQLHNACSARRAWDSNPR